MSLSFGNPAESLEGVELANGWKVKKIVKKKPHETGGHFSVCYTVEKDSKEAFLKAFDFAEAFGSDDLISKLNSLTTAFIFERDLLYKCKNKHLGKIVTPLDHGQYNIIGQPSYLSVYYIIFDIAKSNLRNQISNMQKFDLAWIMRSLHHTAVGINQLHQNGIAHQDLKPSNVLIFDKESKIGDLGRSSDLNVPGPNDKFIVPGDSTYAPFELFYKIEFGNNFQLRYASDLYHLGSLIFFYFLRLNLQQIILCEMEKNDLIKNITRRDFQSDLPYFQEGFTYALKMLENEISKYSLTLKNELIPLVKMLCEPDPSLRGHPADIKSKHSQYSLIRFISKFDQIAKKAEYGLL